MTNLTQDQMYVLATQLQQREREMYADIGRELGKDEGYVQNAGEVGDPGDASVADLIGDLNNAEVSRDIGELRRIGTALQRLRAGTYGVCVCCGNDIPFARLRAQPTALRCVPCQTAYERSQAGEGPGPTL